MAKSRKRIEDEYYRQYGYAIARWVDIEHALAFWFAYLCGTTTTLNMANEVFASPRSFNGNKDMLEAAFYAARRSPELVAFFKEAMKRVMSYYGTRNFMAHHQTIYVAPEKRMALAKRTDGFLQNRVLGTADLKRAARNFERLQKILLLTLPTLVPKPRLTLKQGLARIHRLPPDACSVARSWKSRPNPMPYPKLQR
ncbi:MAG: hypothetical protein GC190_19660 [Alphaproteobacteria bacterium]|nr:hypothetical protein [Alphaproteobacteria bacterium]